MAANRARVPARKPRQDAILMVYVLAGHLTGLGSELERIHADGAMAVSPDVVVDDLYRRH